MNQNDDNQQGGQKRQPGGPQIGQPGSPKGVPQGGPKGAVPSRPGQGDQGQGRTEKQGDRR